MYGIIHNKITKFLNDIIFKYINAVMMKFFTLSNNF